jgi:hypothetical protein
MATIAARGDTVFHTLFMEVSSLLSNYDRSCSLVEMVFHINLEEIFFQVCIPKPVFVAQASPSSLSLFL